MEQKTTRFFESRNKSAQTERLWYLDQQISSVSHQLCLLQKASDTDTHKRDSVISQDGSEWNPKETLAIIPGPRWRNITKCFVSLLVGRRAIRDKSNRGPAALLWGVTGEPSRRWNFACFNLPDRHYKPLPEEDHFMVLLASKRWEERNEGKREMAGGGQSW